MNITNCFAISLSEYQNFASNALYDQTSSTYWYGDDKISKIFSVSIRIILSLPLYLANGIFSLAGRVTNCIVPSHEEVSRIHNTELSYSPLGQEALDFAREQLVNHPQQLPVISAEYEHSAMWYRSEYYLKPVNQEITLLTILYDNVFEPVLFDLLKQHQEDPWNQPAVIEAADACMKIGYAISALTLDDLDPFNERLAASGFFARVKTRTNEETLVRQDSYQYRTFYTCTNIYHAIRGGLYYQEEEGSFNFPKREKCVYEETQFHFSRAGELPSPDTNVFYAEQTIQNSWKRLYNDYCNRVRFYADTRDLYNADERHVKWTQNDIAPHTFFHTPSTQPT